ncbi:CBO0543 family protein [Neobacillus kokaensis]|uniref:CBO0543 family protein n=1 Tax=Neobacillus kokaensis TaxID=2759023 RepID=UPI00351A223D
MVFCIKAFYSGFIDSFVVSHKKVVYPVRLLPNVFHINILFDLLLFPIVCVLYNKLTYRTSLLKTVSSVFIFSTPILLGEIWAEKNTKLIKYKNNWSWAHSFESLTVSFWFVRATMALLRRLDKTTKEAYEAESL